MKKKFLCALMALVMVLALCACGSKTAPAEETSAAQTAASSEAAVRELGLSDWSLSASTWSSPNGATIHLTATPTSHVQGDSAVFIVRLEGEEVTSVPCDWENDAYMASADLNAADGYCYYVSLSGEDGASAEIAVNTPADPTEENYVNMATALETYCSLTVGESTLTGDTLTIADGTAVVQAPRITDDGENIACAQAMLVLILDEEEIGSMALTMAPGEADRSYEASLANVSFTIPGELTEDQRLVLRLDAELTNGQALTVQGATWYYQDGGMATAVG